MKISVITVCYNSEKFIEDAIKSVLNQSYQEIEYIVIDGGSKDNTLAIISKYKSFINTFISEPDKGIYDAMNKGINVATGDYIAFLNSDDFYTNTEAIASVVAVLKETKVDSLYANINYVRPLDVESIVRKWRTGSFDKHRFQYGWHPAHPTFVVKKEVYDKYGSFNLSFSLAADFELMLRFLECYKISHYYLDEVLIHMRLGGATSSGFKNFVKQNIECMKAFKVNGLKVSIFYPFYRLLPKLSQFIH